MTVATTTERLAPFGIVVTVPEGTAWSALDAEQVQAWVREHRVLVVRGVAALDKRDLPGAARSLGPLLAFSFGSVNELRPEKDAKNYLYTTRAVPLHWDGAFLGKVPHYLFFHCVDAPDVAGGETLFVDTTRVWSHADQETRDRWRSLRFVYETDTIAHYGGRFEARVVAQHPSTHETVLRFAEPVDDVNPVSVHADGLDPLASARMITELRAALGAEDATLAHAWQSGDVVVADNHALLHGRRAFAGGEKRHIRRVNVAGPERSWKNALADSLRIRRPEFMVAELPILLVPALLVAGAGRLSSGAFFELAALFFLLFHFGDMINCLADRELDAVYKTHLSEAIHGLGVRNVTWQIALTVVGALGLGAHLAWSSGRSAILLLVLAGLTLGAQYSVGPLRLKGRGVWQVIGLWAVIFFGPMVLVASTLAASGGPPPWPLLALFACYGAMQQGIILVNTAEDLPEDTEYGIRTTAVALGARWCLVLAREMVGFGGLAVMAILGWLAFRGGRDVVLTIAPLGAAWVWVMWDVAAAVRVVRGKGLTEAVALLRPRAKRVPIWITATAWTTLWAAAWIGTGWSAR